MHSQSKCDRQTYEGNHEKVDYLLDRKFSLARKDEAAPAGAGRYNPNLPSAARWAFLSRPAKRD